MTDVEVNKTSVATYCSVFTSVVGKHAMVLRRVRSGSALSSELLVRGHDNASFVLFNPNITNYFGSSRISDTGGDFDFTPLSSDDDDSANVSFSTALQPKKLLFSAPLSAESVTLSQRKCENVPDPRDPSTGPTVFCGTVDARSNTWVSMEFVAPENSAGSAFLPPSIRFVFNGSFPYTYTFKDVRGIVDGVVVADLTSAIDPGWIRRNNNGTYTLGRAWTQSNVLLAACKAPVGPTRLSGLFCGSSSDGRMSMVMDTDNYLTAVWVHRSKGASYWATCYAYRFADGGMTKIVPSPDCLELLVTNVTLMLGSNKQLEVRMNVTVISNHISDENPFKWNFSVLLSPSQCQAAAPSSALRCHLFRARGASNESYFTFSTSPIEGSPIISAFSMTGSILFTSGLSPVVRCTASGTGVAVLNGFYVPVSENYEYPSCIDSRTSDIAPFVRSDAVGFSIGTGSTAGSAPSFRVSNVTGDFTVPLSASSCLARPPEGWYCGTGIDSISYRGVNWPVTVSLKYSGIVSSLYSLVHDNGYNHSTGITRPLEFSGSIISYGNGTAVPGFDFALNYNARKTHRLEYWTGAQLPTGETIGPHFVAVLSSPRPGTPLQALRFRLLPSNCVAARFPPTGTYCGLNGSMNARMSVVQYSTIRDEIKLAGFFTITDASRKPPILLVTHTPDQGDPIMSFPKDMKVTNETRFMPLGNAVRLQLFEAAVTESFKLVHKKYVGDATAEYVDGGKVPTWRLTYEGVQLSLELGGCGSFSLPSLFYSADVKQAPEMKQHIDFLNLRLFSVHEQDLLDPVPVKYSVLSFISNSRSRITWAEWQRVPTFPSTPKEGQHTIVLQIMSLTADKSLFIMATRSSTGDDVTLHGSIIPSASAPPSQYINFTFIPLLPGLWRSETMCAASNTTDGPMWFMKANSYDGAVLRTSICPLKESSTWRLCQNGGIGELRLSGSDSATTAWEFTTPFSCRPNFTLRAAAASDDDAPLELSDPDLDCGAEPISAVTLRPCGRRLAQEYCGVDNSDPSSDFFLSVGEANPDRLSLRGSLVVRKRNPEMLLQFPLDVWSVADRLHIISTTSNSNKQQEANFTLSRLNSASGAITTQLQYRDTVSGNNRRVNVTMLPCTRMEPLTMITRGGPVLVEEGSAATVTFGSSLRVLSLNTTLVVVDTNNHCIRTIDVGSGLVRTLAGKCGASGFADGAGRAARFANPRDVAVDRLRGVLFAADTGNNALRRISLCGNVTTAALNASSQSKEPLESPVGVAVVAATGRLLVSDMHRIRIFDPTTAALSLIAGSGESGFANGAGAAARFNAPGRAAMSGQNYYVPDTGNNCIRRLTSGGVVSTFAGGSTRGFLNGAMLAAQFDGPTEILLGSGNVLYVVDAGNAVIRRVPISGGSVTTVSDALAGLSSLTNVSTSNAPIFAAAGPRVVRLRAVS
jgi:hypothetical protein